MGGGGATLMIFSEMAAKPLDGSRWNFAKLMGHSLSNFSKKKWSGQVRSYDVIRTSDGLGDIFVKLTPLVGTLFRPWFLTSTDDRPSPPTMAPARPPATLGTLNLAWTRPKLAPLCGATDRSYRRTIGTFLSNLRRKCLFPADQHFLANKISPK